MPADIHASPLAGLSPASRAGLLPLLRALDAKLPAWKTRPTSQDIARAALAGIEQRATEAFLALDGALLALGADLCAGDLDFGCIGHSTGNNALHLALGAGAIPIVRGLLARGVDLEIPSGSDGLRPLHVAVLSDEAELIRLLLDQGADPDALDARGRSARQLAETVSWKRGLHRGHALLNGEPGDDEQRGG